MKKISFLFAVCSVLYLSIMASGCSKDLNYVKACEEKDWAKAYAIADELESIALEKELDWRDAQEDHGLEGRGQVGPRTEYYNASKKAKEAKKYVIFHEAMYVLEENGENGLLRIAGIIKEHDAKWLYRELIDVARKTGDKDLEEKLVNMEDVEIRQEVTNFEELTEQEKNEIRMHMDSSYYMRYEDTW